MKAGVYYGVEDFKVAEFPEPELKGRRRKDRSEVLRSLWNRCT